MKIDPKFNPDLSGNIKYVIAIPTYNEASTLSILLSDIAQKIMGDGVVLILDDSPSETSELTQTVSFNAFSGSQGYLFFSSYGQKSGRGAAIRRGMEFSRKYFPNLDFFIECDADGSHQVVDIFDILNFQVKVDLLIGSRYLKSSKISGWPMKRLIFSKLLNLTITRSLKIPIKDITNGLRRYSVPAIDCIIKTTPITHGFIYLTEQALIINNHKLLIQELPISFVNRIADESTVTWREIFSSIIGLVKLHLSKHKLNK